MIVPGEPSSTLIMEDSASFAQSVTSPPDVVTVLVRSVTGTCRSAGGFDEEAPAVFVGSGVATGASVGSDMGVRSIIPPKAARPTSKLPTGPMRRNMRHRFKRRAGARVYGQRWQSETTNSMIKRNLGSAMRARRRPPPSRTAVTRAHPQHHAPGEGLVLMPAVRA
jgi:hypothetical protein